MAEAVKQNTPTYNWTLDQEFHHLTVALGYPEKRALYEMEQLRAKVQKYVDGKPRGDPNYRYKDFSLSIRVVRGQRYVVLEGLGWDSRCRVAEQDVRAIRAPSTLGAPLPHSHKPAAPSKKRKRPRVHDRLISLMKDDLDLKPGMLPHEVLRAVKQPYKDKYYDEPSQSSVTRGYDEYEGALTNRGNDLRGMPADLSKLYPATPIYEWLNPAVDSTKRTISTIW